MNRPRVDERTVLRAGRIWGVWLAGLGLGGLLGGSARAGADQAARPMVVVVVGAPGEETYGQQFRDWAAGWRKASLAAGAGYMSVGLEETNTVPDRAILEGKLAGLSRESSQPLWLVFIGHGTYSGEEAKFNLRGPDVTATELAVWLQPFRRPLAVINCASASGPFLAALSGTNRVIMTATQSGHEENFTRFGQYLAEAIADVNADLDKDGQTSLLEAFLTAARGVADFYESAGRLATEHPLLEDNGDGLGTPPDWFEGVRAVKRAAEGALPDGVRAHQFHLVRSEQERALPDTFRAQRDQLEVEVEALRARKADLTEAEYYRRLEVLLLQLAQLYESSGQLPNVPARSE